MFTHNHNPLAMNVPKRTKRAKKSTHVPTELTDFKYIIKRRTFSPLCFGSKSSREVLPLVGRGLNGFMKRYVQDLNPQVGPATYHSEVKGALYPLATKPCSAKGLVRNEARFKEILSTVSPPASKYNIRSRPKTNKRRKIAFGSTSKRSMYNVNNIPGPGQYNVPKPERTLQYSCTFGGKRTLIPSVTVECVPWNPHICEMCRMTPLVDYWHRNYTDFMCVQCFSEEHEEHNKYSTKQLREFQLMRDCRYMHQHDGGTPAITILPKEYIQMKRNIETYLDMYFDEFIPQAPFDVSIRAEPGVVNFKDTTSFYAQFQKYLMQIKKRKQTATLEKTEKPTDEVVEEE